MDSLVLLALSLAVLAAVALRETETFCPEGWTDSAGGRCTKRFDALRCGVTMLPGGELEFDAACSKYARDMITRQTR